MPGNEITVKIKCGLEEFYKILEEKKFKIIDRFSLDDTYFIPKDLKIKNMSSREILSKAIIIRKITEKKPFKVKIKVTFKQKEFDKDGNILNQESINCDVMNIEDAKKILEAIGYKELINIKEDDIVYEKKGFELAIKNINNGDKLIEIETVETDSKFDTIEKLKKELINLDIPIYTDNYFVKKAEVELDKILNKHYAYMLRCSDNSIYSGYAVDPYKREKVHNTGKGAKYTRTRLPVKLVYFEEFDNKVDAMKREYAFKQYTHAEKEKIIKNKGEI